MAFGADYDDPMEEIKKVRQTGAVKIIRLLLRGI